MARKKVSGTVGRGGVNPAPVVDDCTVRCAAEQLVMMGIDDLVPYANNAKRHTAKQINQIRASLREFGFVTPVLIDFDNNIIAGHGRVEAARAEGLTEVPCVLVSNLTEAQRKAYILADNRLSETAAWDPELLQIELEGLADLKFDADLIGFDTDSMAMFPVGAEPDGDAADYGTADDYGTDFTLPDGDKPKICQMTFTLHTRQKELIEYALSIVDDEITETFGNQNKNGNALYEVVRQWAERGK